MNRTGTVVFRVRRVVLSSLSCLRSVRKVVHARDIGTRCTISAATSGFTRVFTSVSSTCVRKHTTSIGSISRHILSVLYKIDGKAHRVARPYVITTSSLTPDRAMRLSGRGILKFTAVCNSSGSRATVLTEAVGVPTMVKVKRTLGPGCSKRVTVVSKFAKAVCISPSRRALTGVRRGHTGSLRRGRLLGRLGKGRGIAGDKRGVGICTGVNGMSSLNTMLGGSTNKMNLFEDRFLCLRGDACPARRRRFTTCGRIMRDVTKGGIVVHALSVKTSGRISCFGLTGRRGPTLKCETVHVYLAEPRVFGARLHTLCHTSMCKGLSVVFPVVVSMGRIHGVGRVVRRIGTRLERRKLPFGRSMRLNVVVRAPTSIVVDHRLTGRISFFDIKAGSLARCALTVSHRGLTLSRFCSPRRPTMLTVVGVTTSGTRTRKG